MVVTVVPTETKGLESIWRTVIGGML